MFTTICEKVCDFAKDVKGFSFVNIWAYEPKKPSCLVAMHEQAETDEA